MGLGFGNAGMKTICLLYEVCRRGARESARKAHMVIPRRSLDGAGGGGDRFLALFVRFARFAWWGVHDYV